MTGPEVKSSLSSETNHDTPTAFRGPLLTMKPQSTTPRNRVSPSVAVGVT
jgi:hypothetical protein